MKSRFTLTAALAGVAAMALAPAAIGQVTPALSAVSTPQGPTAPNPDRKFIETAARAGIAEVEMAKVALQRGGSVGLKAFADRMVADHGKASRDLAAIAATKGVTMPDRMSTRDQRALARLRTLRGAKFDAEYLKTQLAAHKGAVSLFKRESASGDDADLKAFASATLPTLQHHLAMVADLLSKRKAD